MKIDRSINFLNEVQRMSKGCTLLLALWLWMPLLYGQQQGKAKPFGFVEWTLKNGSKVQYRQTVKPNDYHYIWAYSPGGRSVVSIEDLPSARAMNDVINAEAPTVPEDQSGFIFQVDGHIETLGGRTRHIEPFFKLLQQRMKDMEIQPLVFERYMDAKRDALRPKTDPMSIYQDTLDRIMSNHSPRAEIKLDNPEVLAQVNQDCILKLYRERFGNAADFTFFITGSTPIDSMRMWAEEYIGALPTSSAREQMVDHHTYAPSGIVKNHFKVHMLVPKSTVTIGYTGKLEMNVYNQIRMEYLQGILRLICTEKMREQQKGTYGVHVDGTIEAFPKGHFIFQLNFDTDPSMRGKMMEIAYSEIGQLLQDGPTTEHFEKVRENLLANYRRIKDLEQDVFFWLNRAWMLEVYGLDAQLDMEEIVQSLTGQDIHAFAKQVLDSGNRIEVVMDPL